MRYLQINLFPFLEVYCKKQNAEQRKKLHTILEMQGRIWQKNGWHNFLLIIIKIEMNNWLRTLIAGYAGWRWGGGCLGFIVVFVIVYFLLERC
jgi:hypothetical protein